MVEQRIEAPCVGGSIPSRATSHFIIVQPRYDNGAERFFDLGKVELNDSSINYIISNRIIGIPKLLMRLSNANRMLKDLYPQTAVKYFWEIISSFGDILIKKKHAALAISRLGQRVFSWWIIFAGLLKVQRFRLGIFPQHLAQEQWVLLYGEALTYSPTSRLRKLQKQ